jgi:hypothetical protein
VKRFTEYAANASLVLVFGYGFAFLAIEAFNHLAAKL